MARWASNEFSVLLLRALRHVKQRLETSLSTYFLISNQAEDLRSLKIIVQIIVNLYS